MPQQTVDFHVHIYPDDLAPKIIGATVRALGVPAPGLGTRSGLRSDMARSGIDACVVLPVARSIEGVKPLNDWALTVSGSGIIPFGAIHPCMDGLEDELDRLAARGIRGVKLMPLFQKLFPDGPECDRLYEALIERDMLILAHAGGAPSLDGVEIFGTPERLSRVIASFPEMRIILAHLGGMRMWDEVRRHLLPAGRNVYFDTAYTSYFMGIEEIAGLIEEIGAGRVLFGTDYPYADQKSEMAMIASLGLGEKETDAILFSNAAHLLGLMIPPEHRSRAPSPAP